MTRRATATSRSTTRNSVTPARRPSPGQRPRVAVSELRRGVVPALLRGGLPRRPLRRPRRRPLDEARRHRLHAHRHGQRRHRRPRRHGGGQGARDGLLHGGHDRAAARSRPLRPLLSLTSVMSRTGKPGHGDSSEEALAFLLAPPAPSRAAYIERQVAALHVYGSKPEWLDDDAIRARAAAAYDRCFCPEGIGRQMKAVMHDGSPRPGWPTWTSPPSSSTAAGTRSSTRAAGARPPRSFPARATWRSTAWATTIPHRSGRSGWRSGRSSRTTQRGPDQGGAKRSPGGAPTPVRCFHSDALAEMAAVIKRPTK